MYMLQPSLFIHVEFRGSSSVRHTEFEGMHVIMDLFYCYDWRNILKLNKNIFERHMFCFCCFKLERTLQICWTLFTLGSPLVMHSWSLLNIDDSPIYSLTCSVWATCLLMLLPEITSVALAISSSGQITSVDMICSLCTEILVVGGTCASFPQLQVFRYRGSIVII